MQKRGLDRRRSYRNKPPRLPEWAEILWRIRILEVIFRPAAHVGDCRVGFSPPGCQGGLKPTLLPRPIPEARISLSFPGRPPAVARHGGQGRRLDRRRLRLGRSRFQPLRQEYGPRRHGMEPRIFQRAGNRGRSGWRLRFHGNRLAATPRVRTAARESNCQKASGHPGGRSTDRSVAHAIRLAKASPRTRDMIPRSQKIGAAAAGTLGIIVNLCLVYRSGLDSFSCSHALRGNTLNGRSASM